MSLINLLQSHPLDKYKKSLRSHLLDLVYKNGGHIGGSLSSLDLITAVYYCNYFRFPPNHFILSAGHLAPALYVVLASLGKFPQKELSNYSQFKSILQGHISLSTPGVEYASGSLGQGLSFGVGMALGDKNNYSICLTTDGEHQEGQIWEALACAGKYKLGNLINIVDINGFQIDGSTDDIMPLRSLAQKYIAFGWTVISVNGHDFNQIISAIKRSLNSTYPTCILAKTVLGKGVSFIENDYHYHDVKNLSYDLYEKALKRLNS